MVLRLLNRRIAHAAELFHHNYVDVRVLYALEFDAVPCVKVIGELDVTKAYEFVNERYRILVTKIYQHSYFDYDKQTLLFNSTILLMRNKRLVELCHGFCQILHTPDQHEWARKLVNELRDFREVKEETRSRVIGFTRESDVN